MPFALADRLKALPPYLFAEIDRKRAVLEARGVELINLSIADPDHPTPELIVSAMMQALRDPTTHRYPAYSGCRAFREAACGWMQSHYQVPLDPETECVALIGSKEGLAHLPWSVVNPGDVVLVPDPGYPVYASSTGFAGGIPYLVPLQRERGFLPDLRAIPKDIAAKAKLFFLNYPNNPTAACATREFFTEVVAFAKEYHIILAHDAAYLEIFYDNERPLSLLQIDGARDVTIEFHSLSKTFNMTGWRLGFAVGHPALVGGLAKLKTNVDSGVFTAVQHAGVTALTTAADCVVGIRARYQQRRDVLVAGLRKIGLDVTAPQATFYLWTPIPTAEDSTTFVTRVMDTAGVILTPGRGFGSHGDRYFRFILTAPTEQLEAAVARLQRCL